MSTITTISGLRLDLLQPAEDSIHILDIAQGLSLQCRFAGQLAEFYSVAQHSVLVSRLVPPADALWGLMHDASEAYTSDVQAPIKHSPLMSGFRMIEAGLMKVIARRFGLSEEMPASVKDADQVALATELHDLRCYTPEQAFRVAGAMPSTMRIEPLHWEAARRGFLARYREITARMDDLRINRGVCTCGVTMQLVRPGKLQCPNCEAR